MSLTNISQSKATAIGFIAPLLWSSFTVLALSAGDIPPFEILSIAFITSSILSIFIQLAQGHNPLSLFKNKKYLLIGVSGIFGFNSFFISGVKMGPPAEVFLMGSTWPILAIMLNSIILKEHLKLHHIISCLMGFSGIVFIAMHSGFSGFDLANIESYSFGLIAAIMWSVYSVLSKKYHIPANMIGSFCSIAGVFSIILHFTIEQTVPLSSIQITKIIIIGIAPLCLAYYAWNFGVKHGDMRTLTALAFLGSFLSMTWLIVFGFSPLTWEIILASFLIIGGVVVSSLGTLFSNRKSKKHS